MSHLSCPFLFELYRDRRFYVLGVFHFTTVSAFILSRWHRIDCIVKKQRLPPTQREILKFCRNDPYKGGGWFFCVCTSRLFVAVFPVRDPPSRGWSVWVGIVCTLTAEVNHSLRAPLTYAIARAQQPGGGCWSDVLTCRAFPKSEWRKQSFVRTQNVRVLTYHLNNHPGVNVLSAVCECVLHKRSVGVCVACVERRVRVCVACVCRTGY